MRILKISTLLCTFFLLARLCHGQQNDVDFLVSKIKNAYAGYNDKVKGNAFDNYIKKVTKENKQDTFLILSKIVNYFNDNHLLIFALNTFEDNPLDTGACSENLGMVTTFFSDPQNKINTREGYWVNDFHNLVIAIKKQKGPGNKYKAYLIESRRPDAPLGLVIAEMEQRGKDKFYTKYLIFKSGMRFTFLSEFRNDSILTMGDISKWRKIKHYDKPILPTLTPYDGSTTGSLLNADNYLLTVPDFSEPNNEVVDSIVRADYNKIASAKTLIIDIRDNSGGTVRSYSSLFPFIYTKPIIQTEGYTYASEELIQHREEGLNELKGASKPDTEKIKDIESGIHKLEAYKGKFMFEPGNVIRFDHVLPKPQNVAIITNYACQSAAEMMLLDFKQSDKVTIFGERTMGAVDYLDFYPMELPSKKYTLYLATFKRQIPFGQNGIDGIGIPPDILIGDNVADWVEFVQSYYSNKH